MQCQNVSVVSAFGLKLLDPIILFNPSEQLYLREGMFALARLRQKGPNAIAGVCTELSAARACFPASVLRRTCREIHFWNTRVVHSENVSHQGEEAKRSSVALGEFEVCQHFRTLLLMPARSLPLNPLRTYTDPRVSSSATRFTFLSAP